MTVTIKDFAREAVKTGALFPSVLMLGPHSKDGLEKRKVSTLRERIAKCGLDELGLSMAEIARHAGVPTSSIAKPVARMEEEG